MSRQKIPMMDETLLVIGYDKPFSTWYAQHYDDRDEDKPPRVVIGYHPAEQAILKAERPDAVIGPYPVDEFETGLAPLIAELMGIPADEKQPDCVYCGKPLFRSNPNCVDHPYDRLRS